MDWIEREQNYVRMGIEELPQYLSSEPLYWPLSQSITPLTIGNLLFALRRLSVQIGSKSFVQEARLQLDEIRQTKRVHFQKKELQEVGSRIREWSMEGEEWEENGVTPASMKAGLRNRAVLELLLADLDQVSQAEQIKLAGIDRSFENGTEPGPFIWKSEFEAAFTADKFWFLWRKSIGRAK